MNDYSPVGVDQYMLSVLSDELTADEADNALTALSALTSVHPETYPFNRTFARPDHQRDRNGAAGVRFIVYGEFGMERMIRVPRADLASLETLIDSVLAWAGRIAPAA